MFLTDRDGTIYQTASLLKITWHAGKIKPFPERYPANVDSIGIEIVGKAQKENDQDPVYETVNNQQNSSLKWLVSGLLETLDISASEVYKHPDVARKNKTEASTASW
ncbi:N-acetylmuramoyl-L-alanine amidase [Morganella morganii]|nr:N-acetylmuramoyl-L-alanine amidase [Morganella morganii]